MMKRLIPSILGWVVVVIVLSLAPTIETYNGHVTTNVAGATNSAYMIGMTAVDDFGGFIMIMGLLVSAGLFAVAGMRFKNVTVGDMMAVIGSVIISVVALAIFSGTAIGKIDELITAGSGFAKTAYGILTIIVYIAIISAGTVTTGYKAYRSAKPRRKKGAAVARYV